VIADNVGDNVGDCAGMAADLFETFAVTVVADNCWSAGLLQGCWCGWRRSEHPLPARHLGCFDPRIDVGCLFVKAREGARIMNALYRGLIVAGIISLVLFYPVTNWILGPYAAQANTSVMNLYLAAVVGSCSRVRSCISLSTTLEPSSHRSNTSRRRPTTGHATNIIAGIAVSMKACAWPVLAICVAILASHQLAGLYGIAVAATAMLSMTGIIVALDAYGPITDNAGGSPRWRAAKEVRNITDPLDAVGNTTKAVTKGYAIGSAGLAALVLFADYTGGLEQAVSSRVRSFEPKVIVGCSSAA